MSEDEIPTIAEKVSFWQEQDRINQAIIPRVMEIHESLTAVGKRQSEISGQIAVLDACASGAITRFKGGSRQQPFLVDASSNMKGHAFLTSIFGPI